MTIETNAELVGIVGLGQIGLPMAKNIMASGRRVIGWSRSAEEMQSFAEAGGIVADDAMAVGTARTVITVVFDDDATRQVVLEPKGFIDAMAPGSTHIAMETISPALSRTLSEEHQRRGQHYLAAPVFGRPEVAVAGKLAINCSGSQDVYRAVTPLLSTMGTPRWVGPKPEQAMMIKLMGNNMIFIVAELLREMYLFLRSGGISDRDAKEIILDPFFPGPIFSGYSQWLISQPDARIPLGSPIPLKDNQLCREAARQMGLNMPLIELIGELARSPDYAETNMSSAPVSANESRRR